MFILTERDEILNLALYRGINVRSSQNKYRIEAYLNKTGGFPGIDLEIIAVFDKQEDALKALKDLASAIKEGEPLWNVQDCKKRMKI